MTKRNKIIYWVFTLWLALGMTSTGIVQLIKTPEEVDMMTRLGYPANIMTLLGVLKLLGVITVLVPGYTLLKEWAYSGFFFNMLGALFSHIVAGSGMNEIFPPILLLALTFISWFLRPGDRKIPTGNINAVTP